MIEKSARSNPVSRGSKTRRTPASPKSSSSAIPASPKVSPQSPRTPLPLSPIYHRKIGARNVTSGVLWIILALAAFFAADSLLFRTGWYTKYLEPDSSAGTLESHLYWLDSAPRSSQPEVLVVGDSRIAEGFSAVTANAAAGGRLHFWNFGVSGTTPRVWYYALRAADPTRRRFAAIAFALDTYSDDDWFAEFDRRTSDQNYLVMQLGLRDCFGFAQSMHDFPLGLHAFFGCLFRGIILRDDVQALLAKPTARLPHVADWRANGLRYITAYEGMPTNLSGMSVDWRHRTIQFPDRIPQATRDNVTRFVLREPADQTGEVARYRRRWLGGILDAYRDSPTRLIFLQLPRGPIVDPEAGKVHNTGFATAAAQSPDVAVLPPDTFTDLERPDLFADGLHLNRDGRPIFSTRLGERIDSILTKGGSR
ncbi:MAG TPA: hypothetical protein VHA14_15210 [Bryobacteraceae bacterium]|nr:hypothetical protein [Bryobacteraceae bacterium]